MSELLQSFTKQQLGAFGEKLAGQALARRGFAIVGRNVRVRFGEVDIIARNLETVLFVEVKTRTSDKFGYPEEAITWKKRLRMSKCAVALAPIYCGKRNWALLVISVEINLQNKTARLVRIELDE